VKLEDHFPNRELNLIMNRKIHYQ